jgi:ATP-dependent RNA helicase DeaD
MKDLRMLVLDEADEMLDRGFQHDVEAILATTPGERQTALFSATMPEWVAKTAHKQMHDPQTVSVDRDVQAPPEIDHIAYDIDKAQKLDALRTLLDRNGGPILVFGRTKHGVKKLAKQLAGFGYPVDALHGNLSQNARERVMVRFRSGKVPILVATNVAARGLDFQGVDQVINFDLPDSELHFTHRAGRTGRMGRHGEAITFITREDSKKWREIERALGRRFPREPWTGTGNASVRPQLATAGPLS